MGNESINTLRYLELLDQKHAEYDPKESYSKDFVVKYRKDLFISNINENKGNLPGESKAWSVVL